MRELSHLSARDKIRQTFALLNSSSNATASTTPRLYVHSNDPNDFADNEVDIPSVIAELTYNFKLYHVDRSDTKNVSWLQFSTYPEDLKMIIETIRYNVNFSRAPGSQVTMSCCVALGLARLHASGSIRRLSQIQSEYKRRRKTGSLIEKFVGRYLSMEVPIQVETGEKCKVAVQPDVKNQVTIISEETGLTQSSVGILAIYATLVQQDNTPDNLKEEWQDRLDKSLELVECKVRGAKSIMEMLK